MRLTAMAIVLMFAGHAQAQWIDMMWTDMPECTNGETATSHRDHLDIAYEYDTEEQGGVWGTRVLTRPLGGAWRDETGWVPVPDDYGTLHVEPFHDHPADCDFLILGFSYCECPMHYNVQVQIGYLDLMTFQWVIVDFDNGNAYHTDAHHSSCEDAVSEHCQITMNWRKRQPLDAWDESILA